MFSGGVDSTATAALLAKQFDRVHLLTYRNGYGHRNFDRTLRRVEELQRTFGDCFVHVQISTKSYFDQILVNGVVEDYRKYRSGFIWCMGCKMAMHMRSAIYCLENGLVHMTDGSNSDTSEMVEQSLLSLSLIKYFYEDHTVVFGTPVYEAQRNESRRAIEDLGLSTGLKVLDRNVGTQPTCVAGELYYIPYVLLNKRVKHEEATVGEFIEEKAGVAHQVMKRYFADKGIELDELLKSRRGQLEAAPAS